MDLERVFENLSDFFMFYEYNYSIKVQRRFEIQRQKECMGFVRLSVGN